MELRKVCIVILLIICIPIKSFASGYSKDEDINKIKQDLFVLMMAYPEQIVDVEKSDNIYIIMKDGTKIIYDDKKSKMYEDKVVNADLEDMLFQGYSITMIEEVMDNNIDPGRIRNYNLLNAMYGDTQEKIEKNLKSIETYYGSVMFTTVNGASKKLQDALNSISEAAKENSIINDYVSPLSGGYNYRYIQDTGLLSPHSYGIAVDLKRDDSDYWKWVSKEKGSQRIKKYPKEIVEAFEAQGFIWGGKWSHFDILHFEYRPEIILKSKYFGEGEYKEKWYDGVEKNEETIKIINLIEQKI